MSAHKTQTTDPLANVGRLLDDVMWYASDSSDEDYEDARKAVRLLIAVAREVDRVSSFWSMPSGAKVYLNELLAFARSLGGPQ